MVQKRPATTRAFCFLSPRPRAFAAAHTIAQAAFLFEVFVAPRYYRDLIIQAAKAGNMQRIDQLAVQLAQAEESRRLIQALTHCPECSGRAVVSLATKCSTAANAKLIERKSHP